MLEDNDDW